jgi:hypothetical protein
VVEIRPVISGGCDDLPLASREVGAR